MCLFLIQAIIFTGPYPEPYLLVRTTSGIVATDLLTLDMKVLINWTKTYEYGLDVDMKKKKLYFSNQHCIYEANLDGTGKETVLENVSANDIAIDWKGRRILWNDYAGKEVFAVNLDDNESKVLVRSKNEYVIHIAVDSKEG